MKKSIFLRLFFIANLLFTLILSLHASTVMPDQRIALSEAINVCNENMRQLIEDNNIKIEPAQFTKDLKLARRQLKAHSDASGTVSLSVVTHLLQAYQQWLTIKYPEAFHGFLRPTAIIRPTTPGSSPQQPILTPSRASRR